MIQTQDVFTCDMCKQQTYTPENSYYAPDGWLVIRMATVRDAGACPDLHICANCKHESLHLIWSTI